MFMAVEVIVVLLLFEYPPKTCRLGKLRTEFITKIAKSTYPGYCTQLSLHAVNCHLKAGEST